MAIKLGDAILFLRGDDKQLDKDLGQAEKKTKGWAGKLGSKLKGLVGGAVLGGVTMLAGAVVGVGKAALQMSAETDEAMRQFQAATGVSTEQLGEFRNVATDVFESGWGESIGEVTEAMAAVHQTLGLTGDELEAATRKALIFGETFGADVGETMNGVSGIVNNFGLSAEEAFDIVTKGSQEGANRAGDLLDVVREYSANFAQAGFSADEMVGILVQGLEGGALSADKVGDAVREFGIRLTDGSETTRTALNSLFSEMGQGSEEAARLQSEIDTLTSEIEAQEGALAENEEQLRQAQDEFAASSEKVRELSSRLVEAKNELRSLTAPKLQGMDEIDDQIFNMQQQIKKAKLELLNLPEGTAEYDAVKGRIEGMNKELEKLQLQRDITYDEQFRALEKAAEGAGDKAVSFDQAMANIAAKKQEVAGIAGELRKAEKEAARDEAAVRQLEAAHEALVASLAENEEGLAALEEALASTDTPADEFLQSLSDLDITGKDAMQTVLDGLRQVEDPLKRNQLGVALFGSMWEDMGEDAILALNPATAGLEDFEGATEAAGQTLQRGLGGAWERLKRKGIGKIGEALGPPLASAMDALTPYLEKFADWLGVAIPQAVQWLKETWAQVWPDVQKVLETAWSIIQPLVETIASFWSEQFGWVIDWFKDNWPLIQETAQMVLEFVWGLVQEILGAIREFWEKHGEKIMRVVGNVWTVIKTIFGTALKTIFDLVKAVMQFITGDTEGAAKTLQGIWERLKEAIVTVVTSLWDTVKELFTLGLEAIGEFITNIWENAKEIGDNIVEGIKAGISAGWEAFKEWLIGKLEEAVGGLLGFLGIDSPSKLFAWIGENMMSGLAKGIGDGVVMPVRAIHDASRAMAGINLPHPGTGRMGINLPHPAGIGAGGGVHVEFHVDRMVVSSQQSAEQEVRKFGYLLTSELRRRGLAPRGR